MSDIIPRLIEMERLRDKATKLKEAIAKAERLESKLVNDATFDIGGFTSPKIRHLLNNLGCINDVYFEVGVHRGATFCAANYDNELYSIACDNFSEFNADGKIEQEFEENCKKYLQNGCFQFMNMDCFDITLLPRFDFYLYDGNHSYEAQKKAFTHFKPFMENECMVCVDDYNWADVQKGTQDGIKECRFEILFEQHLTDGFHNGFYVAVLKKQL